MNDPQEPRREPGADDPTVEQPAAAQAEPGKPAEPETTATAEPGLPPQQAWGPPPPGYTPVRQPGGFRRFVGHRATQLVGVGLLGVLIGGGVVGGIAAATSHGPHAGRPGIHRQYDGHGFDGRGGHRH